MHGLAPANASKRGNVRKGFSASRLSASSRVASLTYYPCQPRLTETLTTARDEAVCAIQQHAAALPVTLHERLDSSTQRLNLPAPAHQRRPREELRVFVVVRLASFESERAGVACRGRAVRRLRSRKVKWLGSKLCQKRNTQWIQIFSQQTEEHLLREEKRLDKRNTVSISAVAQNASGGALVGAAGGGRGERSPGSCAPGSHCRRAQAACAVFGLLFDGRSLHHPFVDLSATVAALLVCNTQGRARRTPCLWLVFILESVKSRDQI
jgi:hypothetical protein